MLIIPYSEYVFVTTCFPWRIAFTAQDPEGKYNKVHAICHGMHVL